MIESDVIGSGVLCVGRVYCDLVFSGLQSMPEPGHEIYASGLSLHTGGGAAITAHYLAALGRSTSLCANLPAAPFSKIIEETLQPTVNIQYCSVPTSVDPQITVVLTGQMDRSFVTRRAEHALPDNYAESIETCAQTGVVKHLHIGELATLLDHPDLIMLARNADWSVSLDCAWDEDAIKDNRAKQMIEAVDVFLPNQIELQALSGIGVTENTAALTVVKKGEHGAQAFSGQGTFESPAEVTKCIDTTGAGDAFDAGFLDAWLRKESLTKCLESGNRCGAQAVGHSGGIAAG